MKHELLTFIECEVLGWPGVWKKRLENGPDGVAVSGYRFGHKQIAHVHDGGHADFRFSRGSGRVDPVRTRDISPRVSEQPRDGGLRDPDSRR